MLFLHSLRGLSALVNIRLLKRRVPLFIAWNVTFKCNLHCLYCGTHDMKQEEMGTAEVIEGLESLWNLGARWITFGGGEPMMRDDIGHILHAAKRRGFQVYLSTNGTLAQEKRRDLEAVDHVNLSIDGEQEVHDFIRGKGSFAKAMEALSVFQSLGVPVSLVCVLSKHNLKQIYGVLEIAAAHGLGVMFQPAAKLLNSSSRPNPICPSEGAYRETINTIITFKKKGAPVRNSLGGLHHLAQWPDSARLWCPAGTLISVVEPNGSLLACHLAQNGCFQKYPEVGRTLKDQFEKLRRPRNCSQCWCAPLVELSHLFSFHFEAIQNLLALYP